MNGSWHIGVYENQRLVYSVTLAGPVELGRQQDFREAPLSYQQANGASRVVIAPIEEHAVSRQHVLVEPLADNWVRLTNLSGKQSIRLNNSSDVQPQASCDVALPLLLSIGARTVRIELAGPGPPLE